MTDRYVFILEDSSKSTFGGGQQITLSILEILKKNNYHLTLFDSGKPSVFKEKASRFVDKSVSYVTYGKIQGYDKPSFNVGWKEKLFFPLQVIRNVWRIKKEINHCPEKKVILYAATKKGLVYAYILKCLYNIPYIYHAHSYHDMESRGMQLMKRLYEKAAVVVCVSDFLKDSFPFSNTVTIHNPIRSAIQKAVRSLEGKNRVTISSISSLVKYKGTAYFMESYPYIESEKDSYLYVYGEGAEATNLKKLENAHVKLKGFAHDVSTILMETDIVVHPAIAEESFGLVIAEAMAAGIPVITTNIGGQAEVAPHMVAALHVPIRDPKAIGEAIGMLIRDGELYHKLSAGALQQSQRFSYAKFEEKVIQLFLTVKSDQEIGKN